MDDELERFLKQRQARIENEEQFTEDLSNYFDTYYADKALEEAEKEEEQARLNNSRRIKPKWEIS